MQWPGVIRVLSDTDKYFQHETSTWAIEWRVSIQATDAPTPSASYIQPSVSFCSINRWVSACFNTMLLISHVTTSYKMQIHCRFRNTESQQSSCQSSVSPGLEHSCAQLRAQCDRCGGTCDSRLPSCHWPVMTIDPHCAAARHARGVAGVYCAMAFPQTGKNAQFWHKICEWTIKKPLKRFKDFHEFCWGGERSNIVLVTVHEMMDIY